MILHRGNAGDGAYVEATEDELRERGLTDDQIGELRGKRAARRNGPVVSLAGDKRLADVLRELDDGPMAANEGRTEALQLASLIGGDHARALRTLHFAWFAVAFALFSLGFTLGGVCHRMFGGSTP